MHDGSPSWNQTDWPGIGSCVRTERFRGAQISQLSGTKYNIGGRSEFMQDENCAGRPRSLMSGALTALQASSPRPESAAFVIS